MNNLMWCIGLGNRLDLLRDPLKISFEISLILGDIQKPSRHSPG